MTSRLRQLAEDAARGRDLLLTLYEFQRVYQAALGDEHGGPAAVRRNLLAAFVELGELAAALNIKWYREEKAPDLAEVTGEFADALAFVLNALLHAGVTPDELSAGIEAVMDKNLRRLESGENRQGVR